MSDDKQNLTEAQQRALSKLKHGEWLCAYELDKSLSTLRSLVKKRLAVTRYDKIGSLFSPRTAVYFKLPFCVD